MKGKAAVELQLKHFHLKIQEAATKNVAITERKVKQYARQTKYISQGH